MAARKKAPIETPGRHPDKDIWRIVVEKVESNSQLLAEAMEGGFRQVHQKIDDFRAETNQRLETLEAVVKRNSTDIQVLSSRVDQNSTDINRLTTVVDSLDSRVAVLTEKVNDLDVRMEKLEHIEERVTRLEQNRH